MRNMMKAVKKLKFWSRKKKKRKNHQPYYPLPPPYPPPPPPCHHCHACSSSTEPSSLHPYRHGLKLNRTMGPSRNPVSNLPQKSSSYQQYMVPEPVYGIPITHTATQERSGGLFGCVFGFGAHLFRCVFPCFHIRE
ncbi:uncharacterized protein LOC114721293 [Neltuma alba]|uniref:uncharacterized protein LOC114721293 n=1 Tax=Neltuma alba TaxID=207710 RepID=UPI0010A412C9|nr:uncharacterized protein LOC114721293 [Prosopis alba]